MKVKKTKGEAGVVWFIACCAIVAVVLAIHYIFFGDVKSGVKQTQTTVMDEFVNTFEKEKEK